MAFTYLDLTGFQADTIMPAGEIARLEARTPGWIANRCARWSSYVNDRLKKRYSVPFDTASPPATIIRWIVDLVTFDAYRKIGFSPTSAQDEAAIVEPYKTALTELLEAANSETGLFDLPQRNDQQNTSAITQSYPLSYSEQSPYVWLRKQSDAGRQEDENV